MIVYYGTRLYGRVSELGTAKIATKFAHIYWMPLFPLGSTLILEEHGNGTYTGIPAGLHLKSTFAAYARTWGIVALVASLFNLRTDVALFEYAHDWTALIGGGLFAVATAALVGYAWLRLGKLSLDERAVRLVYADHCGHPVDVADLRDARDQLRDHLAAQVASEAPRLGSGYRFEGATSDWTGVATDPLVTDKRFLGMALTLARVEGSLAIDPRERARFADVHGKVWERLRAADPSLLENAVALR